MRGVKRNPFTAGFATGAKTIVHEDFGFGGVDFRLAANMTIGRQRSFRRRAGTVLPSRVLERHNGLIGQRVHVEPRQRTPPVRRRRLFQQVEHGAHLVQNAGQARIWIGDEGDTARMQDGEEVGQLLLVHAQRIGVEEDGLHEFREERFVGERRHLEVSQGLTYEKI